jgi:type III secretion system low calcium response chaperone LcrH/SycD
MSEAAEADPDVARLAELAEQIIAGRTDLAVIQGITDDELEAVYTLGHGFYGSGKYADALEMFRFLCVHRHLEARYWFGLAATNQMLGEIPAAVQAYGVCALLDVDDPQVPLRAAECFRQLGDETNARSALEAAIIVAGADPKKAAYAERARLMLGALQNGVSQGPATQAMAGSA